MPRTVIDRELPSREASDLLTLAFDLVEKELLPRASSAEAAEEFPRDVFAQLGALGLLGLPYPEEFGGVRPAGDGVPADARGTRKGLAHRRSRNQRPRAVLSRPSGIRRRGAEATLASRHAGRRDARRLLPVRTAGRIRSGGDADHRDAGRRRLPAQRRQGVDHPRVGGRLLPRARPHRRRRRPGDQRVPGPRRHRMASLPGPPNARWACGARRPLRCTSPMRGWMRIGCSGSKARGSWWP